MPPARSETPGVNPKKVPSACARCRRQKLKCDIQRPCLLCTRAGIECVVADTDIRRSQSSQSSVDRRRDTGPRKRRQRTKRRNQHAPPEQESRIAASPEVPAVASGTETATPGCQSSTSTQTTRDPRVGAPWNSTSAAMSFVGQAFHHHHLTSPEGPEVSAFTAQQTGSPAEAGSTRHDDSPAQRSWQVASPSRNVGAPLRASLTSILTMDELEALIATRAAELLIDNYFNRIHWFMLIFHQSDFRDRFQQLHAAGKWKQGAVQQRSGFLSVCLAVCLVSLRYTSPEQQQHLSALGVPPPRLQEQLLATLRQRILDIVSLGSIEAVQTCVLLGSFYLYHGVPELAWPICGCGLRIAQALNLHRQIREQQQPIVDLDDPTQRAEETRKRCWWAVYEIDTFCSMLYGYPLGITDSDCDVQLLNAYAASEKNSTWGSVESQRAHGQATLLSYKRCMAELSIIVKSALTGLYALHRRGSEETTRASRLKDLAATVKSLDTRLGDWYRSLPVKLQWGEHPETSAHVHASESEVGLHARLFQLQTLALKLAFENARILIHRPYISFRTVQNSHSQPDKNPGPPLDICWSSIESCRDAALQISRVGTSPVAKEAADTYALSFVSVHLFTAGVTLSIIASLRPLAPQSQEAKLGLRRLMGMQSLLKAKSIVAEQGFQILCKLTRLVMQKETSTMLDFDETGPGDPVTSTEANKASNKDGEWLPPSQDQLHVATNGPAQTSESMAQPRDQATPQFELHQDPTVAQALLDFEQVMGHVANDAAGGTDMFFGQDINESCFNAQDQGWMWSFNAWM